MRLATAALAALLICSSLARAQSTFPNLDQEPACQSLMPSASGGPHPLTPAAVDDATGFAAAAARRPLFGSAA